MKTSSLINSTISLIAITAIFLIFLCMPFSYKAQPLPIDMGQSEEEVSDQILPLIKRGDALLQAKQYDEAIANYKAAIAKADRPVFTAYLNLGSAYYEKGDLQPAIEAYRKAIGIRPNDYRGHYNLAEALYASGNYHDSETEYRRVISLNTKGVIKAQAHHFLGLALYKQGHEDEAIAEYRIAIEQLGGKYAEAHYNLGIALLERKDYLGAERELRITIEQDKAFAEAHFNLGIVLEGQRRFQEAAEEYESYLRLNSNTSEAERLRARIERLKKQK